MLRGRCRIQNAKDLYDFGTKSLTTTKSGTCRRRIFRYLETIQRDFPLSFKPVNKIRSIHNVRNKNSEGHLSLNDLSCFSCENCSNDLGEECLNVSKTGYSRVHMMEREHHLQSNNEAEISENTLPMTSLVSCESIIAVFTDDSDYDYFLLLVKKTLNVLSKSSTDSWGTRLPRGTEVFSGLYYDRQADPLQYKLIEKKTAVVPADSLVYICAELNGTAILSLPESIHLDILECINERVCRA